MNNQTDVDDALANSVVAGVSSFSIAVNTKGGAATTIDLLFTAVDGTAGTASVDIDPNNPSQPSLIDIDSSDVTWEGDASGLAIASVEFLAGDVDYRVGGDVSYTEITPADVGLDLPVIITDADGDMDDGNITGTITSDGEENSIELTEVPDELYVGSNEDNTRTTEGGNDVLVGDVGGNKTTITPGQDYNVSLVVDSSGSIANQLSLLKDALKKLAGQLVNHDGSVNLQIVSFETNAETLLTLNDITNTDGALSTIESAIDDLDADGGTNYEAAFLEAKQWFDGQQNDYENLTFFLTDGDPTYHLDASGEPTRDGSGLQTSVGNLQNTIDAFGPLSEISTVYGIGLGSNNVNEEYLKFFDNTEVVGQGTAQLGVSETTLADFFGSNDPLDHSNSWSKLPGSDSSGGAGRYYGNYLTVWDGYGNAATTVASDAFDVDVDGSQVEFVYRTYDSSSSDSFGWKLQRKNDSGPQWEDVGGFETLERTGSGTSITSDELSSGTYRIVFRVEDNSSSGLSDLDVDDIKLIAPNLVVGPVGEPSLIDTAEELDNVLEGGSTQQVPAEVGDDVLRGGDGEDILFGDAVEHPDQPGEGFQGILDKLEAELGQVPTNDQVLDYLKDNHESLVLPQDQGGDDTLIGGAGDDILIGGAGADTFAWEFGDEGDVGAPAEDIVRDFTVVGDTEDGQFGDTDEPDADRLDLADLLQDEENHDISDYIFAEEDSGNVVLYISSNGSLAGDKGNADQTITLEGKSFADFGGDVSDSADLIQQMIDSGQLNIDQ
ncbi:VWA domain-containing protein [Halomonas sp. G15]|uniref:VWA domain-containing protein n=1 Tax=Halomonas sp. G15 TaxID=2903521 RepID=UPI001E6074FE|nr:VWA domain-containing protein [Halomonas sp. G15]MCE0733385.1 VWA domain-containing protein [Halomonas sp. G15]